MNVQAVEDQLSLQFLLSANVPGKANAVVGGLGGKFSCCFPESLTRSNDGFGGISMYIE